MTLVLVSKKYIVIGILVLLALAFVATRWLDTHLLWHHVQSNALLPRKLQGTPKTLQTGCQIMENGMWVGQSCHHLADKPFSKKLGQVMKNLGIKSVVDLGCGQGQYIKELSMLLGSGNTIKDNFRGYDGNVNTSQWDVSGGLCKGGVDLASPMTWQPADAAISIEVGEHIPKKFESTFVSNIVGSARKMIVLTWAPPGQGGEGHVNNQTPEHIATQIQKSGVFKKNENLTRSLKESATLQWIKANLQVFLSST